MLAKSKGSSFVNSLAVSLLSLLMTKIVESVLKAAIYYTFPKSNTTGALLMVQATLLLQFILIVSIPYFLEQ